jgi:hypothetical protein
MFLIEQIQSIMPLWMIRYLCPLLIVGCFLISFRPWLHAKAYVALSIYVLSLFTAAVAQRVMAQMVMAQMVIADVKLAAVVGGIFAPTLYSVLFVGVGLFRRWRMPYGHRNSSLPLRPFNWPLRPNRLTRFLQGALGGCVGGVTGSTLGALLSIGLLMITSLLASGLNITWYHNRGVQHIVDNIVMISGLLGVGLGLLAGWGFFNLKQLGDKLLIYATIHLFIVNSILKRIWKRIRS